MERMTVDNPQNNREALLNFAYTGEDGNVKLRYADRKAGVDLCEYVANNACCEEVDAAAVMDGACAECDCKTSILYFVAIQAAELRERLKYWEDLEEEGRLVVLPCKVGDKVYGVNEIYEYGGKWRKEIVPQVVEMFAVDTDEDSHSFDAFGKTVFLTLEEAETALKGETR